VFGTAMITLHKASPSDVPSIVQYIEKKAAFDRQLGCFDGKLGTTQERIAKALFGSPVFAYALLAKQDERLVGFAFYHYHFSSFQALPSLWLDDLYVDEDARRLGAGRALMGALATAASEHDCTNLAWIAAANNPSGIPFYTKLGANVIVRQELGLTYSITPAALATRIAELNQPNQHLQPTPR
jgi:GNAT superfamily N-acetyltransferase